MKSACPSAKCISACSRQCAHGQPRPPAATPHEYLSTLRVALPEAEGELSGITDAYTDARYGPAPLANERVSRVNACWWRVRDWLERP